MTEKQRKYILKRDGNRCQFRYFRNGKIKQCFETGRLEVHHVLSRRFMGVWFKEHDVDNPLNMITLCQNHHQSVMHPDISEALSGLDIKTAMSNVMDARNKIVAKGEVYWNTKWDCILILFARVNTYDCKDTFPVKRGKRKND